jgi:hypothetical protein
MASSLWSRWYVSESLSATRTNTAPGQHVAGKIRCALLVPRKAPNKITQEEWEVLSTTMANKATPEDVSQYYHDIATKYHIDLNTPARVVVARDTRASGSRLLGCVQDGLKAAGAEIKDFGFLTTPQLHYVVRSLNTEGTREAYGTPTEKGYYEKFGAAFKNALKGKKPNGSLTVDCANGVGGPKLTELIKHLPTKEEGGLEIHVVNDNVIKPESLNVEVSNLRTECVPDSYDVDTSFSVAPTTSRPTKGHLPRQKLDLMIAAALSMVMRTE